MRSRGWLPRMWVGAGGDERKRRISPEKERCCLGVRRGRWLLRPPRPQL